MNAVFLCMGAKDLMMMMMMMSTHSRSKPAAPLQVGACVPAESLRMSPVDAMFVRMGAKDSIMTGQSTFYIELAETAAMLQKATAR